MSIFEHFFGKNESPDTEDLEKHSFYELQAKYDELLVENRVQRDLIRQRDEQLNGLAARVSELEGVILRFNNTILPARVCPNTLFLLFQCTQNRRYFYFSSITNSSGIRAAQRRAGNAFSRDMSKFGIMEAECVLSITMVKSDCAFIFLERVPGFTQPNTACKNLIIVHSTNPDIFITNVRDVLSSN